MLLFCLFVGSVSAMIGYLEDGKRGLTGGFLIGFAGFGPLFYFILA